MKNRKKRRISGTFYREVITPGARSFAVGVTILFTVIFFGLSDRAVAQSEAAEVEFWQSVKDSKEPAELGAYLEQYPNGKFAPLARIRLKKLSPGTTAPADAAPISQPKPQTPVKLPEFVPDNTDATDISCQQKLGRQGYAEADFSGTGFICLCRSPYELSVDGNSCVRPPGVNAAVPRVQDDVVEKPAPVKRRVQPKKRIVPRRKAKPVRRLNRQAIANRYCRRRYGSDLVSVSIKKSKFYCKYKVGSDDFIGTKKKKFKDVR